MGTTDFCFKCYNTGEVTSYDCAVWDAKNMRVEPCDCGRAASKGHGGK